MKSLRILMTAVALAGAGAGTQATEAERPREWVSADGTSRITGTLVAHMGGEVTLLRSDDRRFTFPVEKLSAADRSYLESRKSVKPVEKSKNSRPPDAIALANALGGIKLGLSRQEVVAVLDRHPRFSSALPAALRGRTGLNGIYRITSNGREYGLYLDFDEDGRLLATSLQGGDELCETSLQSVWEACRGEFDGAGMTALLQADYPNPETIGEQAAIITDVYQRAQGFLTMGLARKEEGLILVMGTASRNPVAGGGKQ